MKANAIACPVAGVIQNLPRARRIMRILRDIAVVGPVLRRQHAVSRARLVAQQVMNDGLDIDGVGDCVAHPNILQNGIAQVHGEVGVNRAVRLHDREIAIALESNHGVGCQRVDGDVGALLAQLERARGGVGNHFELHALQLGRRGPIVGIALDHDFFVHLRAHKAKRARADGIAIEVLAAAIRHDADGAIGQVPQQRRKRLLQMEDDGVVVGRVDVVDRGVGACLSAANFAAEERIEGPLHVARGQQLSVVEVDAVMQMKDVRLRDREFPSCRPATAAG